MPGFREFIRSSNGQYVAIGLVVLGLAAAGYSVYSSFGSSDAAAVANDRIFVDAATGKGFHHTLSLDDRYPIPAPSGGKTGYPAELCYWTKDGSAKKEPTPVLLNNWLNKPGPTICPDCGRLVVPHNPFPDPGVKPPPTQAELQARSH